MSATDPSVDKLPPLPVLTGTPPRAKQELIDEGPCWVYFQLSHRRRFLRTLYLFPFNLIALILPTESMFGLGRIPVVLILTALWAIQLAWEYVAWQREKHSPKP